MAEGLVEVEGEVSNIASRHVGLGYDYDDAVSLVYAELPVDNVLGDAGLGGFRVEGGLGVDDDALDLEDGWDAEDEG